MGMLHPSVRYSYGCDPLAAGESVHLITASTVPIRNHNVSKLGRRPRMYIPLMVLFAA